MIDRSRARGPATLARFGWLILMVLTGCGGELPVLRVEGVEPSSVAYGDPSWIILRGNFEPRLTLDLSKEAEVGLADDFEVEVGGRPALSVRRLRSDGLEVLLPRGLLPGTYEVRVRDPRGHAVVLPHALEIRFPEQLPTRFAFVTSIRSVDVGVWSAPIQVELQDVDGRPSITPWPQELRMESSPPGSIRLGDEDASPAARFQLGAGTSRVAFSFSAGAPGFYTATVTGRELAPASQLVLVGPRGHPVRLGFLHDSRHVAAGQPFEVRVAVLDASGGPATMPPGGLAVRVRAADAVGVATSPGGPFGEEVGVTIPEDVGCVRLYVRATRAGSPFRLEARSEAQGVEPPPEPAELQLTVAPGPLAAFVVRRSSTADVVAGVLEDFRIQAVDAYGNEIAWSGAVDLLSGAGVISATLEGGRADVQLIFTRAGETTLTVVDHAWPPHTGGPIQVRVRPGPFARLAVSTPDPEQVVDRPFPLTVRALDAYGNEVVEPHRVSLVAAKVSPDAISPRRSDWFVGSTTLSVTISEVAAETAITVSEDDVRQTTGLFAVLPVPLPRAADSNGGGPERPDEER